MMMTINNNKVESLHNGHLGDKKENGRCQELVVTRRKGCNIAHVFFEGVKYFVKKYLF